MKHLTDLATVPLGLIAILLAAAAPPDDRRPYEQGPLTADDFRGAPRDTEPLAAKTATELRYDFRYRYSSEGTESYTAELESFEVKAFIRRDLSWNRSPENRELLEHEQGHADIAYISCLQARLEFAPLIARNEALKVVAATRKQAVDALVKAVKERMDRFQTSMTESNLQYDQATRHGIGGKQAEWRRVQQETLKRLESQWKRVESDPEKAADD